MDGTFSEFERSNTSTRPARGCQVSCAETRCYNREKEKEEEEEQIMILDSINERTSVNRQGNN